MTAYDDTTTPPDIQETDKRMTEAQRIRLDILSDQTGEPTPDDHLSQDEAAHMIEELRAEAGDDKNTDDQDEP